MLDICFECSDKCDKVILLILSLHILKFSTLLQNFSWFSRTQSDGNLPRTRATTPATQGYLEWWLFGFLSQPLSDYTLPELSLCYLASLRYLPWLPPYLPRETSRKCIQNRILLSPNKSILCTKKKWCVWGENAFFWSLWKKRDLWWHSTLPIMDLGRLSF